MKVALVSPSLSDMPDVDAVSVCPTCTVPLIAGAPFAALLKSGNHRCGSRARQRLLVTSVVSERHPNLDGLALV